QVSQGTHPEGVGASMLEHLLGPHQTVPPNQGLFLDRTRRMHPDVYSMATSSAEDVPRTLDFLFSRNRLNVAVSRAMCLVCIVASPRLLESRARTIEQMRLINALCRFAEMAGEQTGSRESDLEH